MRVVAGVKSTVNKVDVLSESRFRLSRIERMGTGYSPRADADFREVDAPGYVPELSPSTRLARRTTADSSESDNPHPPGDLPHRLADNIPRD